MERNGESRLLEHLLRQGARDRPFVLIDAGANRGDYTRLVLDLGRRHGRGVQVHAFEPGPAALATLRAEFGGQAQVRISACGLADRAGTAILYGGTGGSSLASLVPRPILGGAAPVGIPLTRLDGYLQSAAVEHVDFLKLDVEGSEMSALRGAGECLRPGMIDALQFEYGGTTLDARGTLAEIYRFLMDRGYRVGKLRPREVEIREYQPWMENFEFSIYVALHPRWGERPGA